MHDYVRKEMSWVINWERPDTSPPKNRTNERVSTLREEVLYYLGGWHAVKELKCRKHLSPDQTRSNIAALIMIIRMPLGGRGGVC